MAEHKIVTIGRQFGSGGHEIGNRLATRLDIPLYDNNLISMAAHELSISQEAAEKVDEYDPRKVFCLPMWLICGIIRYLSTTVMSRCR